MRFAPSVVVAAVLAAPALALSPQDGTLELNWNGKSVEQSKVLAKLEPKRSDALSDALAAYGSWAQDHEYRLTLDSGARVLLVHASKLNKRKGPLGLAEEVFDRLGELFPMDRAPELVLPRPASARTPGSARATDRYMASEEAWERSQEQSLESTPEMPVVFLFRGDDDLASLLDSLGEQHEYLRSWIPGAKSQAGFTLEQPLAAGILVAGEGLEEFDPEGELVNRMTRLALLQRFGRLPEWFSLGLAWSMEMELRKGVYCFPGRADFVGVTEHGSWDKALRSRFRAKDAPTELMPLLNEVTGSSFQAERSHLAFGAVSFLAQHHTSALEEFAAACARDRRVGERKDTGGGTWTLIADYVAPIETQDGFLRELVGEDWQQELDRFFEKGKSYRPKKK